MSFFEIDPKLQQEIFAKLRAKYNIPPGGFAPPKIAPPPPPEEPRAAEPITPYLLERFGLTEVPPLLRSLAEQGHDRLCPANKVRISVGAATCGRLADASRYTTLLKKIKDLQSGAVIAEVGCLGACYAEPLIDVRCPDGNHYLYGRVDQFSFWRLVQAAKGDKPERVWGSLRERRPGVLTHFRDLEFTADEFGNLQQFMDDQQRSVSGCCGLIDPQSPAEYAACGGFFALWRVLSAKEPQAVTEAAAAAGLRGRGGAGFPTAEKLRLAAASADPVRFVIANADEGDPGAYMDRALLESDPFRVLEGLMLAAYAVGARRAFIFIRREYPLAVERLRHAIAALEEAGLLGEQILGSDLSLDVAIVRSGGAFVCGEETALLRVLEGSRGTPYPRPPHPAARGLDGHPTVISNVETYANLPAIVADAAAFRRFGTADSPGTKIFCLTGDVKRTGSIEVGFGADCRRVIEELGIADGELKAVQIGGPSGGILPFGEFSLDYDTMRRTGAMVGSGGLVALNDRRCLVDLARHLTEFMAAESCGQCLLCRDGLAELTRLLTLLTEGRGYDGILEEIESLARAVAAGSLCALGRTAVNPVLTTLRYFRAEYEAHLRGVCPAHSCKKLIRFEIDTTRCTRETCKICYTVCPDHAVELRSGHDHVYVDNEKCTRCWACAEICPTGSIHPVTGVRESGGEV